MQINIISIAGGLGNQMFQYAYYYSLKSKKRYSYYYAAPYYKHNGYELHRVFGISKNTILSLYLRFLKKLKPFVTRNIDTNWGNYIKIPATDKLIVCHSGYWQCEKYFIKAADQLKKKFRFNLNKLDAQNISILNTIKSTQSVSVHIRRGDYYSNKGANDLLGNICNINYYQKAIQKINTLLTCEITLFIFSDEPDWFKNKYSKANTIYIDWNTGKDSWIDMFLMSQCKHNIIANSSFSWWGAWLNNNPQKKIIAPRKWFNHIEHCDIVPQEWIKIDNY
jgi:hypothetical protein